ncbi:MAG TPA: hypothetical protein VLR49_00740 [Ferruginibacter sp.]|nr:hypothetical protein [Ferruginibacter sp.]
MQTGKILSSAIVGTSAMTLFSYLVSESENKNFREPEVLGQLIKRLPISCSKETAQIAGWSIHYAVGLLFLVIYDELWRQKNINPSFTSGALLGAASGVAGITGWKGTFELHPNPPAKNLTKFFGHLLLAHIVFGVFSALTYKLTLAEK